MGIKKRIVQYGYKKGEPEVRKAVMKDKKLTKEQKAGYKAGEKIGRHLIMDKKKKKKKKKK